MDLEKLEAEARAALVIPTEHPLLATSEQDVAAAWAKDALALIAEVRRFERERDEARAQVERLREVRDVFAEALHELECGFWATGTVPEMMEAVRVIVRTAVDKADPPRSDS